VLKYLHTLKIGGAEEQRIQPKENLSKHLENGIFELRVSFENRISRNFYFYESDKRIIFTHGFVKRNRRPER